MEHRVVPAVALKDPSAQGEHASAALLGFAVPGRHGVHSVAAPASA
jgi:hypothetical protein